MRSLVFGFACLLLAACGGGGGGGGSVPAPAPPVIENKVPVANAGADLTTSLSSSGIVLDGSSSSDPDGDSLRFSWVLQSQPSGSSATIENETSQQPTLQTMVPGDYIIELTVSDGRGGTSIDEVSLTLENDAPVVSIDPVETSLAIGEVVTLNPTGSSDPNGHALTYNWSLKSAPIASNLVESFEGPVPMVAFDTEGQFEVEVDVSDGYETTTETLTFEVTEFVQNTLAESFNYLETDAVGDVTAIADERTVRIIASDGTLLNAYELPKTIIHLAISTNGSWIGVAHLDAVSMIRQSDGAVFGPWPVSLQPGDLIIGNDGIAHTFPQTGQWVRARSIAPETGAESLGAGRRLIRHRTIAKPHPDGNKAYGANNGLSPSDLERYELSDGRVEWQYDSPYHGDYPFNGNLWIAENGEMILAASGVVVRSTDTQSTDLTFMMQLELKGVIVDATYNSTTDQWYLIERTADVSNVNVYDGSSGQFVSSIQLPQLSSRADSSTTPTHVVSDKSSETIRIFATDHPTNPQTFAVFERSFVARDLLDFPPEVRTPTSTAGLVGETIVLDASASSDPEGKELEFSWSLDSEPETSSLVLADTDASSLEFRPLVAGTYVFTLSVSDGTRSAAPVTINVRVTEPGDGVQFRLLGAPADIVYNKSKNQIIYVSSERAELRIRDLSDSSEQVIVLPRIGLRVDVSPKGDFAAVSHPGLVSLIDLRGDQAVLSDMQEFSEDWGDIVVNDLPIAFLIPNRDQWVDFYAFDFDGDRVTSRYGARAGTQVRMHPSGESVYAADRGLSPSDIERWSVGNIDEIRGVDSRYHGDYRMSGNIWINEQGDRLIVAGGHVFRASEDPSLDMVYVDTLKSGALPDWADHSSEAGQWLILSSNTLSLVSDTLYETEQSVSVDPLFIDPSNLNPRIEKAFFSDSGDKIIIVARSDSVMTDPYVIQVVNAPS